MKVIVEGDSKKIESLKKLAKGMKLSVSEYKPEIISEDSEYVNDSPVVLEPVKTAPEKPKRGRKKKTE